MNEVNQPNPTQGGSKSAVKLIVLVLALSGVVGTALIGGLIALVWANRPRITESTESLADARASYQTVLERSGKSPQRFDNPSSTSGFSYLNYESDGRLLFGAFVKPKGEGPFPAVVYCHGGFAMGKSDVDSARTFVDAGYAVFVPTWRGENDNQGNFELYYGEADDAVAAVEFIASHPAVDENHVYLFGHSAGGTLALLAAELTDRPRAVVACGATPSMELAVKAFGEKPFDEVPYAWNKERENLLRSPASFVRDLNCAVHLIFGADEHLLISQAKQMEAFAKREGKECTIEIVDGTDHFTALGPAIRSAARFFAKTLQEPQPTTSRPLAYPNGKQDLTILANELLATIQPVVPQGSAQDAAPTQEAAANSSKEFDWSGFAPQANRVRTMDYRFFPNNGYWVSNRMFGEPLFLASLDGSKRIDFDDFPTLFNAAYDSSATPAGVAPDGHHFAVKWSHKRTKEDKDWNVLLTIHKTSDASVIHAVDDVRDCRFLSNGKLLMRFIKTDPSKPRSQLWSVLDLESGVQSKPVALPYGARIAVSADGDRLVTLTRKESSSHLVVRDATTLDVLSESTHPETPVGENLVISSDGVEVATVGQGKLTIWDVATGKASHSAPADKSYRFVHWLDGRKFLALDQHLIIARDGGARVCYVENRTRDTDRLQQPPPQFGHWAWIESGNSSLLRRYNIERIRALHRDQLNAPPPRVRLVATSTDGRGQDEPHPILRKLITDILQRSYDMTLVDEDPDTIVYVNYRMAPFMKSDMWGEEVEEKPRSILGRPVKPSMPPAGAMNNHIHSLRVDLLMRILAPESVNHGTYGQASWSGKVETKVTLDVVDLGRDQSLELQMAGLVQAFAELELPEPQNLRTLRTVIPMLTSAPAANPIEKKSIRVKVSPQQLRDQTNALLSARGAESLPYQLRVFHRKYDKSDGYITAINFVETKDGLKLLAGLEDKPEIAVIDMQGEKELLSLGARLAGWARQIHTTADGKRWIVQSLSSTAIGSHDQPTRRLKALPYLKKIELSPDGQYVYGMLQSEPRIVGWRFDELLENGRGNKIEVNTDVATGFACVPGSDDLILHDREHVWRFDPAKETELWRIPATNPQALRFDEESGMLRITERLTRSVQRQIVDPENGEVKESNVPGGDSLSRIENPDRTLHVGSVGDGRLAIHRTADNQLIKLLLVGNRSNKNYFVTTAH